MYAFSQLQGKGRVVQWCCCREKHKNGGEHYHLALKLDRNERWLSAKEFLLKEFGISVHFSNKHHNYFSAHQKLVLQRIDISLTADTPIFCTGKRPLMYIKNGLVDERETEMMNVR